MAAPKRELEWSVPGAVEAKAYVVVDGVDQPPVLTTQDVLVTSITHVVTTNFIADHIGIRRWAKNITGGAGSIWMTPREWADLTPAAAWARYIERTENIIDDLKGEVETREKRLGGALAEYAKVDPSRTP